MAVTKIKTTSSFTNLTKYDSFLAGNAAYVPPSYESIASASTGNQTITFSSIPSTYTHLQIRINNQHWQGGTAYGRQIRMNFNGDTGTNYSWHALYGDGTSAVATGGATASYIDYAGWTPDHSLLSNNLYGATIIDIHNYASTTQYKTSRSFCGADGNVADTLYRVILSSGSWRNTAAISSITLTANANGFDPNGTFALYGIKG